MAKEDDVDSVRLALKEYYSSVIEPTVMARAEVRLNALLENHLAATQQSTDEMRQAFAARVQELRDTLEAVQNEQTRTAQEHLQAVKLETDATSEAEKRLTALQDHLTRLVELQERNVVAAHDLAAAESERKRLEEQASAAQDALATAQATIRDLATASTQQEEAYRRALIQNSANEDHDQIRELAQSLQTIGSTLGAGLAALTTQVEEIKATVAALPPPGSGTVEPTSRKHSAAGTADFQPVLDAITALRQHLDSHSGGQTQATIGPIEKVAAWFGLAMKAVTKAPVATAQAALEPSQEEASTAADDPQRRSRSHWVNWGFAVAFLVSLAFNVVQCVKTEPAPTRPAPPPVAAPKEPSAEDKGWALLKTEAALGDLCSGARCNTFEQAWTNASEQSRQYRILEVAANKVGQLHCQRADRTVSNALTRDLQDKLNALAGCLSDDMLKVDGDAEPDKTKAKVLTQTLLRRLAATAPAPEVTEQEPAEPKAVEPRPQASGNHPGGNSGPRPQTSPPERTPTVTPAPATTTPEGSPPVSSAPEAPR